MVPRSVDLTNYVMTFRQSGSRSNNNASADHTITLVNTSGTNFMVNSRPITGYIYDANGDCIS